MPNRDTFKRLEVLEGRQSQIKTAKKTLDDFYAMSDEERERMMAPFYPGKSQTHHNRK
ncbi:hypothetical protein [Halomonas sp. H5]|uniref:hypothetical protein n=1 Tax=Halomonas sp. H5 TaxID=3423910 RepID=UPI003D361129